MAGGIPRIRIHSPPPFETAPRLDKKKPRSFGMTGAKAGKSKCWRPKPALYDYYELALATVARLPRHKKERCQRAMR